MLVIKIFAKKINYNTIVEIAMPYITQWLSEKDSLFYKIIKNTISKNGKATAFSKVLVTILPKKNNMAASLMPHFDDALIEYANSMLEEKQVIAEITSLKMDSIERRKVKMLKIEVKVDHIDYEKTVDNLLPMLVQKLSEKDEKTKRVADIISGLGELPRNMLQAALGVIPVDQRDDLIAQILSQYNKELIEILNSVVEKNQIEAEISDIKIEASKLS